MRKLGLASCRGWPRGLRRESFRRARLRPPGQKIRSRYFPRPTWSFRPIPGLGQPRSSLPLSPDAARLRRSGPKSQAAGLERHPGR